MINRPGFGVSRIVLRAPAYSSYCVTQTIKYSENSTRQVCGDIWKESI